jgi:hypothetical protein
MLLTVFSLMGCMYQQPMYQPGPYGQQMYGAPGSYAPPGTLVIPQSNAPPHSPGSTFDNDLKEDDFKRDENGSSTDEQFYNDKGVPLGKDPDPNNSAPFNRDLGNP